MQSSSTYATQVFYARLAGLMYLLNYVTSLFGVLVPSWITGSGDFAQKTQRVLTSEHLYRAALVSMAIGWVFIVFLAFALYITLKPVNKRLAQIALFSELGQASVGAVTVILLFAPLWLYTAAPMAGSFSNEQLQTLVSVSQNAGGSGFQISMMFLSVGSTLFFYLFYKSRYIPRLLAGWGVFASVMLFMVSVAVLIFPVYEGPILIGWAPMGITEITTAFWLMIRGIRVPAEIEVNGRT